MHKAGPFVTQSYLCRLMSIALIHNGCTVQPMQSCIEPRLCICNTELLRVDWCEHRASPRLQHSAALEQSVPGLEAPLVAPAPSASAPCVCTLSLPSRPSADNLPQTSTGRRAILRSLTWLDHAQSADNSSDGGSRGCAKMATALGFALRPVPMPPWPAQPLCTSAA